MFKRRKVSWLVLPTLILVGTLTLLNHITAGQKRTGQEPTVDLTELKSSNPKRLAKGKRYDRPKSEPLTELPDAGDALPLTTHWWQGMPALPTAQSDAIVVGNVLAGKAYLSNDRGAVYSEFPVRVEDVLKNSSPVPLYFGERINAERWGGAVRFPSGKVQHYRVAKRGVPQTNEKYVLFLKYNGEDFDILTGYAINDGRVSPLDGDGNLQFSKYEAAPFDVFLRELREAITTSLAKGDEMK